MIEIILSLARILIPLSFLTIGGGQSIIPALYSEFVLYEQFLTDEQFIEAFALSRLTPGPKTLMISIMGWQISGWVGALAASFFIFTPSAILIYFIAKYWQKNKNNEFLIAVEKGLVPIAAGTIFSANFLVLDIAPGGLLAWFTAIFTTVFLIKSKISPFILLAFGGFLFFIVKS